MPKSILFWFHHLYENFWRNMNKKKAKRGDFCILVSSFCVQDLPLVPSVKKRKLAAEQICVEQAKRPKTLVRKWSCSLSWLYRAFCHLNCFRERATTMYSKTCHLRPPTGAAKSGRKDRVVFQQKVALVKSRTCPRKVRYGEVSSARNEADLADFRKESIFWRIDWPLRLLSLKLKEYSFARQSRKTGVQHRWLNRACKISQLLVAFSRWSLSTGEFLYKIWSWGPGGRWMQRR